jgi:hypothetical protein
MTEGIFDVLVAYGSPRFTDQDEMVDGGRKKNEAPNGE